MNIDHRIIYNYIIYLVLYNILEVLTLQVVECYIHRILQRNDDLCRVCEFKSYFYS